MQYLRCAIACFIFPGLQMSAAASITDQQVNADPGAGQPLIRHVTVLLSPAGRNVYQVYAELFRDQLARRTAEVQCVIAEDEQPQQTPGDGELIVRVGLVENDPYLEKLLKEWDMRRPTESDPGPEGYVLKIVPQGKGNLAVIAGTDKRGVMYGLGRLLHATQLVDDGMRLAPLSERSAPQVAIRSCNGSERNAMDSRDREKTGAREWSKAEGFAYQQEQLLLGANALTGGLGRNLPVSMKRYTPEDPTRGIGMDDARMAQRYAVDYIPTKTINAFGSEIPDEWRATGDDGQPDPMCVCPSIPEAREELLRRNEIYFQHVPISILPMKPTDIGGCTCDRCAPWHKTYYALAADMGKLLKKHQPDAKVLIENQQFSDEWNAWLFEQVHNEQGDWLDGWCCGSGSDESSTYYSRPINPRWSRFPGLSPRAAFIRSRLFYLKPGDMVLTRTDVSHWKRAQHGLLVMDPPLSEVYPRRTYNARPAFYHQLITEALPLLDGIMGYAEGNFDDFNKYMLLRLMWDPNLSAHTIALEYYTYHCGPEAGSILAEAVFIGEQNYARVVKDNAANIERVYDMAREAGDRMPVPYKRIDWRWRLFAQRATTDLYILRKMQQEQAIYDRIMKQLAASLGTNRLQSDLRIADNLLADIHETAEMSRLREEAEKLDEQTNELAAVRSIALQYMVVVDSVGVRWLQDQVRQALQAENPDVQQRIIADAVAYDKVGPGEYYDNCGTIDAQPHYDPMSGMCYYGTGLWRGNGRPSQRSYDYTNERQPALAFDYENLDAAISYDVSVMHPNPSGVGFGKNSTNAFEVFADNERLGLAAPTGQDFERFTFAVPQSVSADGKVRIELRPATGSRTACISEIWMVRRGSFTQQ